MGKRAGVVKDEVGLHIKAGKLKINFITVTTCLGENKREEERPGRGSWTP